MSEEQPQLNSILAVDFGSVTTRAVLFGLAKGRYRLVACAEAPTTAMPPFGDVGEGLRHALSELARATGRVMLSEVDQLLIPEHGPGVGADEFVVTASGGRPMRAVLVGLVPTISVESARRASSVTYMTVVDTINLADMRSENEQIDSIISLAPDVVFIVGGIDGGAEGAVLNLVKRIGVAVSLMEQGRRPRVLFAGNATLRQQVQEVFSEQTDTHIADNVRPNLADEMLDSAQTRLGVVYDDYKSSSAGGFREISRMSKVGVLPTSQGFSRLLGFLSASQEDGARPRPALGVDVGSATTVLATAWEDGNLVSVRSDLGLGHSAVTALDAIGAENMMRWLTYELDPEDVRDYAWNKWLRPRTVPQSKADLEMEMAFAREIIRLALEGARSSWRRLPRQGAGLPPFNPIVLAGAVFGHAPHPGYAALLALDTLQPNGVTRLLVDPYGLTPALGALAYVAPLAVVQSLEAGDLPVLGTVIAPVGRLKAGDTALRVRVKVGDRTRDESVRAGSIRMIPLGVDQADVIVKPHRRLDLGRGGGRAVNLRAPGGMLGLICDARGRPLAMPRTRDERARLYAQWMAQALGQEDAVLS